MKVTSIYIYIFNQNQNFIKNHLHNFQTSEKTGTRFRYYMLGKLVNTDFIRLVSIDKHKKGINWTIIQKS